MNRVYCLFRKKERKKFRSGPWKGERERVEAERARSKLVARPGTVLIVRYMQGNSASALCSLYVAPYLLPSQVLLPRCFRRFFSPFIHIPGEAFKFASYHRSA